MTDVWMIRAGQGGHLAEDFYTGGFVAIGWNETGDLSGAGDSETIRGLYESAFPNRKAGARGNAVAMIHKFVNVFQVGGSVISYDPSSREYLVGEITGDYRFESAHGSKMHHIRDVSWKKRISRDNLSVDARNSLGSTLTIFSVNEDAWAQLESEPKSSKSGDSVAQEESEREQLEQLHEETVERAHELIKDRILELSPDQMERLAAAVLRAMGYRTIVSPKGPDRGVDVMASPDGLGLEEPRIKVEVKHQRGVRISAPDVRSFMGGLQARDRGLFVSTGGFTKDAKYEADRSNAPLTLIDLDSLAELVVSHYEGFDTEGRTLVPLVRVYWPVE